MKNLKDCDFIRSDVPMTKFNVRNLSLAYLRIEKGDAFLDIGGGTGSVSIEAALQGAETVTAESDTEACRLIEQNCKKFSARVRVLEGSAPDILLKPENRSLTFDKCFIGGSGGKLKPIFTYLKTALKKGGILCANFILIKNLNECLTLLEEFGYTDIEVNLIQTAAMGRADLFKAENPVYIVKGVKT